MGGKRTWADSCRRDGKRYQHLHHSRLQLAPLAVAREVSWSDGQPGKLEIWFVGEIDAGSSWLGIKFGHDRQQITKRSAWGSSRTDLRRRIFESLKEGEMS